MEDSKFDDVKFTSRAVETIAHEVKKEKFVDLVI